MAQDLRKFFFYLGLAAIILTAGLWPRPSQAEFTAEYQVKAAFIYNFAKYVEWPRDTFASASAPIRLGIIGDNPFGEALDKISGKLINGHPLIIKELSDYNNLNRFQIIFICSSEIDQLEKIFPRVSTRPILTIAEDQVFHEKGGMITLVLRDNKVRFLINNEEAQKSRLLISSHLLKLASKQQ